MDTEKAPKVLFVIDQISSPYAGTESQLLHLITNLSQDQFQPELLVLRSSEFIESGAVPCKTEVLGASKLFSLGTWFALYRLARRKKKQGIALCHVFFNDSSVVCPPIFSLLGIPTLISRRDMGYWYTPTYLRVLRWTGRCVAGVIANSEAVKTVTSAKERIPEEKIRVIYNGYPDASADPGSATHAERSAIRRELGLPIDGRFVVLVANLRAIKRINDAIEAIATVRQSVPDCHLILVGNGDQDEYRLFAESHGVSDCVHFLGVRSDVKHILPAMDVGLLCSESEGYSNAIVEYMQARLPVVASDVGGNAEAVEHGVTGYLFPRGDVQKLAALLTKALTGTDNSIDGMGEAGYQKARQRHGLKSMIAAHESLYLEMLSERSQAAREEAR